MRGISLGHPGQGRDLYIFPSKKRKSNWGVCVTFSSKKIAEEKRAKTPRFSYTSLILGEAVPEVVFA